MDTFFAGTLKGVGKVYIQTVLDCFSRYVCARLYTSKMPVTAVQILNNHVLPSFEKQGVKIQTILSDNGREYCGRKVGRPQSNGFIETFHHTVLEEHLRTKGKTDDLVRDRRGDSRRTWTCILRLITGAGPTAAAAWKGGRPTMYSRPGSPESEPANPRTGRR